MRSLSLLALLMFSFLASFFGADQFDTEAFDLKPQVYERNLADLEKLLAEMRASLEAEMAMGPKFKQKEFHDFLLKQGLLPPAQLRKAIMEQYAGVKS